MKFPAILAASALLISASSRAADPAPAAPAAPVVPNLDFSQIKSADEFWGELQKLQEIPTRKPATREEAMAQARVWFSTQQAAADAFVKAYPADARRWQAKMLSLRAGLQSRRMSGEQVSLETTRQSLAEIINAPDAPVTVKGEATFMSTAMMMSELDPEKPEGFVAFQKAAADFLAKFGDHPLAGQMKSLQLRVLSKDPTPEGAELLTKLAASTDPETAKVASALIAQKQKLADFKSKPVDLKFTAVDGHPVDLATYRGKVVLVDFWASWCGPCIAEMPNVVSTYQKLHDKGFEIVGISLDQDKAKMEGALKEHGMTWTQYFDGGGWQNKISSSFGITSIPAAWLIDKKGMLRETNLRGKALADGVDKLLAE